MLLKKGCKVTSAIDSRVSFTSRPGAFKVDSNISLEVSLFELSLYKYDDYQTRINNSYERSRFRISKIINWLI